MLPLSIVILTKNEEHTILRCLRSLQGLSDDILVIDSGSQDKTVEYARSQGARVIQMAWQGYSATKNAGNQLAINDWILSLDADEELNDEVRVDIKDIFNKSISAHTAFSIQRKMVYCGNVLHYGAVSNEFRLRLFNRQAGKWNSNDVHEELEFDQAIQMIKMKGFMWHHSYVSKTDHRQRLEKYATLSAQQMHASGKKSTLLKRWISPLFGFIKNYMFRAGFLDGSAGYQYAVNEMWYVRKKYQLLESLT